MRAILNLSTDPYFNIASEEYLLDTSTEDVFMLWRNSPSVIIGKNQNAWAEINTEFVQEHGIAVVRRITGGGAVFHDLGNVNFSFITKADEQSRLNFEKFSRPIIYALSKTGISAQMNGRNDLVAEGFKISGNAECIKNNKYGASVMLHHGTLLFGADISRLVGALKVDPGKIRSKGIKSIGARVKNISELDGYAGPAAVEDFISLLMEEIAPGGADEFSASEIADISKLMREKFATWNWNFGKSPSFETERSERFPFGGVTVSFTCRNGTIEIIKISGDFFGTEDVSKLEELLTGAKYEYTALSSLLSENNDLCERCIAGSSARDIAALITK